jgi:hypothetical protein
MNKSEIDQPGRPEIVPQGLVPGDLDYKQEIAIRLGLNNRYGTSLGEVVFYYAFGKDWGQYAPQQRRLNLVRAIRQKESSGKIEDKDLSQAALLEAIEGRRSQEMMIAEYNPD